MVGAGLRNQKIDINNVGESTPDDTGYRAQGLVPYRLGVYANVAQISGKETNISKTFSTTCTHVVRINYDSSVNQSQVIVWNDRNLHIDGVIDPDGMRRETAIYCTETVGLSCPPTIAKGFSGYSGTNGATGTSGFSGYSGTGISGFSGYSGYSGFSGKSGYSGYSGSGVSGYSGYSGSGISGYSGYSGKSGYSGYSGSPAGSTTYVQYNNSGAFGGTSGFTFTTGTNTATATGALKVDRATTTGYGDSLFNLSVGGSPVFNTYYTSGYVMFDAPAGNTGLWFAQNFLVSNNQGFYNANDGGGITLSGGGTLVKSASNTTIADFESGNITFNQPLKANTINMNGTAIFDSTGTLSIGNSTHGSSVVGFYDAANNNYVMTISAYDSQMNFATGQAIFSGSLETLSLDITQRMRLETFSNTSPSNGDVWYDGTNIKVRLGGVTKTVTVS